MDINIVAIGGTTRESSSTELALRACVAALVERGANASCFVGHQLDLPMYNPEIAERDQRAVRLVAAIRKADGVVIASPGYHGSMSGMVKNALDYIEDLRTDERPYLDGLPVGTIACAYGWQAAVHTLASIRSAAHALRGWPTPFGVAINSGEPAIDEHGRFSQPVNNQLELVASQVYGFAVMRSRAGYGVEVTA